MNMPANRPGTPVEPRRARTISITASVAALSPPILMFGSWLVFTAYHLATGTTPA